MEYEVDQRSLTLFDKSKISKNEVVVVGEISVSVKAASCTSEWWQLWIHGPNIFYGQKVIGDELKSLFGLKYPS